MGDRGRGVGIEERGGEEGVNTLLPTTQERLATSHPQLACMLFVNQISLAHSYEAPQQDYQLTARCVCCF